MKQVKRSRAWAGPLLGMLGGIGLVLAIAAGVPARAQEGLEVRVYLPLGLRANGGPFVARTAQPATATPSPTPEPTEPPEPSATPEPTDPPSPTPTPTQSLPPWQARVHYHRALANLPGVTVNPDWDRGGALHAKYMVKTDHVAHDEQTNSPWYTPEGREAAQLGNIYVFSRPDKTAADAVDGWMTAPFHQIAVLDPELQVSGYGDYGEAVGTWQFGATLSVLRGRPGVADGVRFPIRYPEDGRTLPFLSFNGNESPDPLPSCPGYTAPTGPPLVLMLGAGEVTPNVRSTMLAEVGGGQLPVCSFDETNFKHSNSGQRDLGRAILNSRDAIIVLPKSPLKAGTEYRVTIVNGGDTHSWTFRTAGRAELVDVDPDGRALLR